MSEPVPPDPKRIGDYEIEGLLGAGGMAKVYKARHAILDTHHAIKVLDPEYRANAEARQRFLDEAKIQAKHLDHPNIVKVTNIVATAEYAALVMELIDGTNLEAVLGTLKSQPAEIKRIMLAVLEGVGYAHAAGIIHRDLKPANVLLAKRGNELIPKITDFGIAKVTQPDDGKGGGKKSTHAASRMGTLSYMSPEQVRRAKDVTPRSDIFSLGAMLYEMATGDMAFGGESEYDVMENIVNGRYEPAERRFDKLEPLLADVIQKALQTDPADRFASCAEMAQALRGEIPVVRKKAAAAPAPAPTATESAPTKAPEHEAKPPTAVPEPSDRTDGSKKMMVLVLVIAGLALGGVALYLALNSKDDKPARPNDGSATVVATASADASEAAAPIDARVDDPPPPIDAEVAAVAPMVDASLPVDAPALPPPVDAGVARVRVDAGVARPRVDAGVPKRADAAVTVAATPQNPCAGTWRSKEITITINGSATSCSGSYTLTEVGAFSRGTCSGPISGCRIKNLETAGSYACKYSNPMKGAVDNRGDGDAGNLSIMCGGGNSAVVSVESMRVPHKSISVTR